MSIGIQQYLVAQATVIQNSVVASFDGEQITMPADQSTSPAGANALVLGWDARDLLGEDVVTIEAARAILHGSFRLMLDGPASPDDLEIAVYMMLSATHAIGCGVQWAGGETYSSAWMTSDSVSWSKDTAPSGRTSANGVVARWAQSADVAHADTSLAPFYRLTSGLLWNFEGIGEPVQDAGVLIRGNNASRERDVLVGAASPSNIPPQTIQLRMAVMRSVGGGSPVIFTPRVYSSLYHSEKFA